MADWGSAHGMWRSKSHWSHRYRASSAPGCRQPSHRNNAPPVGTSVSVCGWTSERLDILRCQRGGHLHLYLCRKPGHHGRPIDRTTLSTYTCVCSSIINSCRHISSDVPPSHRTWHRLKSSCKTHKYVLCKILVITRLDPTAALVSSQNMHCRLHA